MNKFDGFTYELKVSTLDDNSKKDEDGCLIPDPYTFKDGSTIIKDNDLQGIYSTMLSLKDTELRDKDYEITINAFNEKGEWMFDLCTTIFDVFCTIGFTDDITKEDIQKELGIKLSI